MQNRGDIQARHVLRPIPSFPTPAPAGLALRLADFRALPGARAARAQRVGDVVAVRRGVAVVHGAVLCLGELAHADGRAPGRVRAEVGWVGGVGGLAIVGVGEEEVGDGGDEVEEEGVEDAGVGVRCPGVETRYNGGWMGWIGWLGSGGMCIPSCAASRERVVTGQGSPLCNGVSGESRYGEDVY